MLGRISHKKENIPVLVEVLQISRTVRSKQRSVSGSLCMFLRHLACRCSDLIQRFGGQVPEHYMITNTVMDLILNAEALQMYADSVFLRGSPL